MKFRAIVALAALLPLSLFTAYLPAAPSSTAGEYSSHFGPLGQLSIEVAQAMPAEKYGFRPHPESMDFGQLMTHIGNANYAFCASLKDSALPALTPPNGKDAIIKYLSDSFSYCSSVISTVTEEQLTSIHNSPDGRLNGREVLLAMYIHVAHHRGQAEIYLRDNGIRPPGYKI
jgi:uncharacterized damage-inducible protein DinB